MIRKLLLMGVLSMFLCATSNAAEGDVFITKNGKKYHKEDCRLIKTKNPKSISKEDALEKGYHPCKVCFKEDVKVEEVK